MLVRGEIAFISRLQKRSERLVIEVPKDQLDKVKDLHGKPLKVIIKEIDLTKV